MNEDRISFDNNVEGGLKYSLPSCVSVEDLMKNKVGITIVLNNMNTQAKANTKTNSRIGRFEVLTYVIATINIFSDCQYYRTVLIAVELFFTSNMYLAFSIILLYLA